MPAPKGNEYWLDRQDHGRKKIYESPQELWAAAIEYFIWVDNNPLLAAEVVKYQGVASLTDLPKMRAMTEGEFVEHSLIGYSTWHNYCSGKDGYEDYLEVTTRIKNIIKNQKFQGAAADMLNPNIIARDLGLVDKQHKDVDATMTVTLANEDEDI
jgi:hypothetical protein